MIGSEQLSLSVQAAVVLTPVAVYFLLLGLLNSQPRPQLISAGPTSSCSTPRSSRCCRCRC